MHYRRVIREALQAQIIAAATIAGANVFTGRARPILEILRKRESVVSIYTGDESAVRSADGQIYERSLTVSVELAAGGGDDLDDVLDAFALSLKTLGLSLSLQLAHLLVHLRSLLRLLKCAALEFKAGLSVDTRSLQDCLFFPLPPSVEGIGFRAALF